MKRRDLLKSIAGLPLGTAAAIAAANADAVAETGQQTSATTGSSAIMPLHAGELSMLIGRPRNGKTTVAMNAALEFIEAGRGAVWYFDMRNRSQEIAALMGLGIEPLTTRANLKSYGTATPAYRATLGGQSIPLTFIHDRFAMTTKLAELQQLAPVLRTQNPGLIIYDADAVDCTRVSAAEEHWMASRLGERRDECRQTFNAALIVTFGMPTGADVKRTNKAPIIADLKPRRGNQPLVDEIYFVHRAALYDDSVADNIDTVQINRVNRLRAESNSKMFVRDAETKRLRDLTGEETLRAHSRTV